MDSPYILEETENFAVVFKPPKMHSSLQNSKQITKNREQIFMNGMRNYFLLFLILCTALILKRTV